MDTINEKLDLLESIDEIIAILDADEESMEVGGENGE